MTNYNFSDAIKMLDVAESVAIFMHINPDPDCLGSALALCLYLKKKGKKAYVFTPDTKTTSMLADKMLFLPGIKLLNKCDVDRFDLSVAVDLGETGRIGEYALPTFYKGEKSLVIDHHETFGDFADLTFRDAKASSTAQLLFFLLAQYDESVIDKDIATLLYAGLVTDSGNFLYESTNEDTFFVAQKLVGYGINLTDITRRLSKDVVYNVFRLKMKILNETRFYCDNKMAVIVYRRNDFLDTATSEKDTDNIINEIQCITSVQLAISIAEVGTNRFKVSFRSKGEVSARACAEAFGGGGHLNASGCRLSGPFEEVYEKLIAVGKSKLLYV